MTEHIPLYEIYLHVMKEIRKELTDLVYANAKDLFQSGKIQIRVASLSLESFCHLPALTSADKYPVSNINHFIRHYAASYTTPHFFFGFEVDQNFFCWRYYSNVHNSTPLPCTLMYVSDINLGKRSSLRWQDAKTKTEQKFLNASPQLVTKSKAIMVLF